jgi:hypothetical protein
MLCLCTGGEEKQGNALVHRPEKRMKQEGQGASWAWLQTEGGESPGGRGRLGFYFPKHCLFDFKTGLKTNLKTKPYKNLILN